MGAGRHSWIAHLPYRTYLCSAKPLIASIIGYTCALLLMGRCNAIANLRRPMPPNDILLNDMAFQVLPHYDDNMPANFLVYSAIWGLSLTMIIHPRRRSLSRRLLTVWAMIYILRCTTIISTSLPDPNHLCRDGRTLNDTIGTFFDGLSCGDMIFSGHTVVLVLGPLMMRQAFVMPKWARVALIMWSLAGMLGLLIVRMHYAVDILVALYLSFLMYVAYHLVATNEELIARWRWLAWWEQDRYYYCSIPNYIAWFRYMYRRHWLKDATAVDPCLPVVDPPPSPGFHPCCHHLPAALGLRLMSGLIAPSSPFPAPHFPTAPLQPLLPTCLCAMFNANGNLDDSPEPHTPIIAHTPVQAAVVAATSGSRRRARSHQGGTSR